MKPRILTLSLVAAALLVGSAAQAQTKFAYVDMQRALGEIEEGKVAKAKLKSRFDAKQKDLDTKQEGLKKKKEQLDAMARDGILKDDKLREKQGELERELMEVTQYWQNSQKELSEEEHRLTQEIFSKMAVIIRGIAESDGFSFVFDKNESGLLYAPDSLDITNELVRKYNAKYGAGKPAASDVPKKDASKPAAPVPAPKK
ncbi:MAG: OmpH family outer membrane protein [Deltaproteobacteria bacterium]|nr:OmpH family outer membrane protein [Deltaproteobacteria bacterium]